MKAIKELIEKITEDYRVLPFDDYEFENYLKSNALEAMGFGQDSHDAQGVPNFSVYKLDKKDWITVNGNVCEAISVESNVGEFVLGSDYQNELDCAQDDGRGEGFEI